MDFAVQYTPEQEEFRREFQSWLGDNVPDNLEPAIDHTHPTPEQFEVGYQFRLKLAERGWHAPTFPKEYGGGGLTTAHAVVIAEELARYPLPQAYDLGLVFCAPAVMVWGTEEQKRRFLPPILRGEWLTWQLYSEPEAGSDLASLRTQAIHDGAEFVVNGSKLWVGSKYRVDHFYLLAVTDPAAPRHANLGAFCIPTDLPGISIRQLDMVCHNKNQVFFDNVRIPASSLIGGETDGWRVAMTTLEVEHGGQGSLLGWGKLVYTLIAYCKETVRNGRPLSKDPRIAGLLAQLYVEAQVGRLMGLRNYWMRAAGVHGSYEGSQSALYGKLFQPRLAKAALEIAGPYAMTGDPRWAPLAGLIEQQQRYSLATHAGGTPEMQRMIIGRRLGIGRPKQAAAPVPQVG